MTRSTSVQSVRRRVAAILDVNESSDQTSLAVDVFLISTICLNVVCIALESVESIGAEYMDAFYAFEVFSVAVFSIEYIARIWACPDSHEMAVSDSWRGRLRFARTPGALIDLLAIAPFYLSMFFAADLRMLRVIRLLRVFKLTRYSATMQGILGVFRDEAQSFVAVFCMLLILLVLASSAVYAIEHDVQPVAFGSIPAAMWWAMATLTTVGYGDVTPITPMGKFFGGLITFISIGVVALPAGILASGFTDLMRRRRQQYENSIAAVLEDGAVTQGERSGLEDLRRRLDLGKEEAELLYDTFVREHAHLPTNCPHCQQALNPPAPERTEPRTH